MKKIFFALMVGLFACNNSKPTESTMSVQDVTLDTTVQNVIDYKLVDNKKDPICGMPVKAGISDTIHYKNKVYGFCAAECKAEFAKSPEQYLSALQ